VNYGISGISGCQGNHGDDDGDGDGDGDCNGTGDGDGDGNGDGNGDQDANTDVLSDFRVQEFKVCKQMMRTKLIISKM